MRLIYGAVNSREITVPWNVNVFCMDDIYSSLWRVWTLMDTSDYLPYTNGGLKVNSDKVMPLDAARCSICKGIWRPIDFGVIFHERKKKT